MTDYTIHRLPLEEVFLDESFNCRGYIPPMDVIDLSKDIKARGLDQPIVVQHYDKSPGHKYRIIAGHRRFTAFKLLALDDEKFTSIPAFIRANVNEREARQLNLTENIHRKALNIKQEALALKYFFDIQFTIKETAEYLKQTTNWVEARKALLALPNDVQDLAASGVLSIAQIKKASRIKKPDDLYNFVKEIKEKTERLQSKEKAEEDKDPVTKKAAPIDLHKANSRKLKEISDMRGHIYEQLGPSLATRALAWAAGDINTFDLETDLIKYGETLNKKYKSVSA